MSGAAAGLFTGVGVAGGVMAFGPMLAPLSASVANTCERLTEQVARGADWVGRGVAEGARALRGFFYGGR